MCQIIGWRGPTAAEASPQLEPSLASTRILGLALPALALRRFAEDWQRPAEPDGQAVHGERHKESGEHRRKTADTQPLSPTYVHAPSTDAVT